MTANDEYRNGLTSKQKNNIATDSERFASIPEYWDLPESVPGYRCSWEYFNTLKSDRDELGTLNFLTPERRMRALQEIKSGRSVSLDLPLNHFAADSAAFGGRKPFTHRLHHPAPFCYEDSLVFNTQSASQWDGFRHFGMVQEGKGCRYYGGVLEEEIEAGNGLGIDAWVKAGGIVGRGVLIDFVRWARSTGQPVEANTGRSITLDEIKAILLHQRTTILPGDILIFRTGWLDWYNHTSPQGRHFELCTCHSPGTHSFIGVQATREFIAWVWNNQIAAVAGDQVAFESTPPPKDGCDLHGHLLAALGCPLGELWDTEGLAEACEERGLWSFFVTSSPLHVPGGVASPANAIAIL